MEPQKPHIDQNALSRQLAVYGHEAQGKLMSLRVFLHGVTGLGVQVAKNLILAGPKQVALYDPAVVTQADVGRNFFCHASNVGKSTRAQACLQKLRQLNSNVQVSIAVDSSIEHIAQNYDCVVVVDNYDRNYLVGLNKACHAKAVGFILAGNLGLYGYTFVDFGDNHRIFDATGEEAKAVHIAGITQEELGVVCMHEDKRHGLCDGDTVVFSQVKGMTEINGKAFKIEVKAPDSFIIGDTRQFTVYQTGGIAQEVKVPFEVKSYDLEKSLRYPYPPDSKEMPIANWDKFGIPEQLHVILNALYSFYALHKRLPEALSEADAAQLVQLVKDHLAVKMDIQGEDFKVENVDQTLVKDVAKFAVAQISPCSSFWGGIITQEIVKLTGKYTPLRQWLHHDFFEILPEGEVTRTILHNDYSLLFGDQFLCKSSRSNSFIIGAGALGCEFIKMFALMSMSTKDGKISVTDDDNIEISNLNRQFLFRREHVGKNKSEIACSVGKKMNPKAHFQSLKLRASPENQLVFNDDFWTRLDFVVNAVDNVKARQYIDQQCVWFGKPLFESGTLGTKCHSQIIIPNVTISYCDIVDPPQQSIPLCTLKNFPYQIEHTIQWARDYFEGTFACPSSQLSSFYTNREPFLAELKKQHRQNPTTLKDKLQSLKRLYQANETRNYAVCVNLAAHLFQDVLNHQINQLLTAFPANHIVEKTQKPFWSGLKRLPTPLNLDLQDHLHLQLIQSAANIFAVMFNLPMEKTPAVVIELAKSVTLPEFVPRKVVIETDENKKEEPVIISEDDEKECEILMKELLSYQIDSKHKTQIVEFEKDDPTNFHIEFMSGVSNLRARNYQIGEVDNFKVKLIAGKIIPAIATTTAMIVGAVGIEIIKFLLGKKNPKNVTINLALPLWVFNDPQEAIINEDKEFDIIMGGAIKVVPGKFTKWDKIEVKGPMTVEAFKKFFEETYKIEVSMITYGTATIYSSYGEDPKKRLPMSIPEAIESVTKKEIPKWRRFLPIGVSGSTPDGVDCLLPDIRFQLY